MKNLLRIGLLALLLPLCAAAQTITIDLPKNVVTEQRLKSYGDSLIKVLSGNVVTPPVDPPVGLDECDKGPFLGDITSISTSGLTFQFDADNVHGIEYWVRDEKGEDVSHGLLTKLQTNKQTIAYAVQKPGTYQLSITGSTCRSKIFTKVFYISGIGIVDPPKPVNSSRQIYMNTTGYGFSLDAKHGISPEWVERAEQFQNLEWNGQKFSGITGLRLCVPWYLYEPTRGKYNDEALLKALKYCIDRKLRLSISFFTERKLGDGMFAATDMLHTGDYSGSYNPSDSLQGIWNPYFDLYTVSPHSPTGQKVLQESVKHMASVLKSYPGSTFDYIALGVGNTEEFYMPVKKNQDHTAMRYGSDYSPVARKLWAQFAAQNGYPGADVQIPWNFPDPFDTGGFWNHSAVSKLWYDFTSEGLFKFHQAFNEGVRSGGGRVCGNFADAGGAQSAWYMTYKLHQLFQGCDLVYSSDGGNAYQLNDKLRAVDFIKYTFPKAASGIEFDPEDINFGNRSYPGEPINWMGAFYPYAKSAFERGNEVTHFAMAFSTASQYGDNISSGAEALWKLNNEFIWNNSTTTTPQGEAIQQVVTSYGGDQPYRSEWSKRGGGLNLQIPIITQ